MSGNRETWTVEGLIHPGLKRTVFVFQKNSLTDLELQIQYDAWPFERYQASLEGFRKHFDTKFQEGPRSTPLLSNMQTGARETRVGYGWKFQNTDLAVLCRSFLSRPPEELSASDFIIHYAERDSNPEIESVGVSEDRWRSDVISPAVAQKLSPAANDVPAGSALGINQTKLLNASHRTETLLSLELGIKLKRNTAIDPTKATVQVYFYDTLGTKEVVLTDADVTYDWRSRRDWKKANSETLTVTYVSSKDKGDNVSAAARKYFGYVAAVYYDGKLQSVRAEPAKLLNLFPPRIFVSPFEEAQAAIARGDYNSAARLYQNAADQGNLSAAESLAWFYAHGKGVMKDYRKAVALYERATLQNLPRALNALAWFLATCPDDAIRSGKEAITHALKACELSYWQEWKYIDTLAAAYAEAGDFDRAINYQKQAIGMKEVPAETRTKMEERLTLYQQRQTYRE